MHSLVIPIMEISAVFLDDFLICRVSGCIDKDLY